MQNFLSAKDLSHRKWLLTIQWKGRCHTFKDFSRNLAVDFVNQLPVAKNIVGIISVKEYYSALNTRANSFKAQLTNKEEVFKRLSNVDPKEVCSLDEIPCWMLKDGVEMLADPILQTTRQ